MDLVPLSNLHKCKSAWIKLLLKYRCYSCRSFNTIKNRYKIYRNIYSTFERCFKFTFPSDRTPLIIHSQHKIQAISKVKAILQMTSPPLSISFDTLRVILYQKYCVGPAFEHSSDIYNSVPFAKT